MPSLPDERVTDADLVSGCLTGNRDAFGNIVARYQSLVCSLAYSATGSLTQSEDLAQDIFVSAWKQLSQLREPAKLRSWLCGIARNRICDALNLRSREPSHAAEPLERADESPAAEASPPEQAINREEEAILWRSVERIPELYREPLILFYREHQSVERVAAQLDLTDDAVRQRLSRGRKLLHDQVLAFVEGALERTNPGKAFTVGVLAALPLAATSAKAAAVAGVAATTAKSSAAAKGAGILPTIGFASALSAATGGIFAVWGRVQRARSDRERRFLARASWGFLIWVIALQVVVVLVISRTGGVIINNFAQAGVWAAVWVVMFSLWMSYSIWTRRRQRQIQIEDGTFIGTTDYRFPDNNPAAKGFKAVAYGGLAAMIFGPGGMLITIVGTAGDRVGCATVSLVAVLTWLIGARAVIRHPARAKTIFNTVWCGLALLTLAILNLRWHVLVRHPEVLWPDNPNALHLAPLYLNFLIVVFFGSIGLAWWLEPLLVRRGRFDKERASTPMAQG